MPSAVVPSSMNIVADHSGALSRSPGTSLHRQLFLVLRDQIVRGIYPPGAVLPKEESLCRSFGVSRITVRRALNDLDQQGFVQRRHGLGTFVRQGLSPARPTANLTLVESLRRVAAETEVEVLDVENVEAPPDIAAQLQLEPGERAVHAVRRRHANGVPLMLTHAWVPVAIGRKVTRAALQKQPLYEILMAQGVKFGRVVQEITAVAADPTLAKWLACEVSSPLLRMTRLLYDLDARPVQHLTVHVTPERSRLLMDLPSESLNTLSGGHFVHDPKYVGTAADEAPRRAVRRPRAPS